MRPHSVRLYALAVPLTLASTPAWSGTPVWSDAFPSGRVAGYVHAAVVFDEDGPGGAPAALFAGGEFEEAGGLLSERIARWDGDRWSAVAPGLDGPVHALAVFDADGAGAQPAVLVAGGQFTTAGGAPASNIAAWNGAGWSALAGGITGTDAAVRTLHVWDADGPGPGNAVLVVGGRFDGAGGQAAGGLATWDGTNWTPLGAGTTQTVWAVADYGSDLWVGGDFDQLDGAPIPRLARFDGSTWASGGTVFPAFGEVRALSTWNDGSGERLAIGGTFDLLDSTVARNVGAWDGTTFQALGSGLGSFTDRVEALAAFDADGADVTLWAAGDFGTGEMRNLARFDGVAWSGLGEFRNSAALGEVRALAPFDADGEGRGGRRLWIGGEFTRVSGVETTRSACEWDGDRLVPLGNGVVPPSGSTASFDPDGSGPGPAFLYVYPVDWGGEFRTGSGRTVAWNGTEWVDPGFDADGAIVRMETLDLGSGPELFVAGQFSKIGGISANHIAKWDGSTWSALGSGIDEFRVALEAWDPDGTGPLPSVLVAAGRSLTLAGGVTVDRIAQWDGSAWSDLGGGAFGYYGVSDLAVFDVDGSGSAPPRLCATKRTDVLCDFDDWFLWLDDGGWQSAGLGYGFLIPEMETYDPDDVGPAPEELYLLVSFPCGPVVKNAPAEVMARWNGSSFQDMGLPYVAEPVSIEVVDLDGDGPGHAALFVDNVTGAGQVGRWDGTAWSVVGHASGANLGSHDPDGPGPAPPLLTVVGGFAAMVDDASGEVISSGGIALYGLDAGDVTAVTDDVHVAAGTTTALSAGRARPTPFREEVRVRFTLARDGVVRASVYDVSGRLVRRLLDAPLPEGSHAIAWDGTERSGQRTGSGVFLLRIEALGESVTRRVVRLD
jgi:FlgD Ig-like domain